MSRQVILETTLILEAIKEGKLTEFSELMTKHDVELDQFWEECALLVTASCTPGEAPQLYGPPENCCPGEPPTVDVELVTLHGVEITEFLTNEFLAGFDEEFITQATEEAVGEREYHQEMEAEAHRDRLEARREQQEREK